MGSVGQPSVVVVGPTTRAREEVTVYVKAGVDGERMGACPFCQRVFMVLLIKSQHNLLRFKVITVNPAKPPPEFKVLGLKHVPALIHGDDGYDALDDIIHYLDTNFPGGGLEYNSPEADLATKDFFSKFCFYIKAVNQDPSKLDQALEKLNHFLEHCTLITSGLTNGDTNHQMKTNKHCIHRYLHAAYTHPVFVRTCPCDQEIILHWHDRPETPKLSHKKHSVIAKEKPKYSFDVPVHASVVTVVDE
nr:chloride intracellular channel exl-1-like [Cherax quadricarinatus]